jgi:thioredoxin-like negative regulator of GroEL
MLVHITQIFKRLQPISHKAQRQGVEMRAAEVAEKKKAADEEFAKKKPERDEKAAEVKFKLAESLLRAGKRDAYRKSLKEIVEKYPDTKLAQEARSRFDGGQNRVVEQQGPRRVRGPCQAERYGAGTTSYVRLSPCCSV